MRVFDIVWVEGTLVERERAVISLLARGVLYGLGAFETMRWRHPRGVFRFKNHMARLTSTAGYLGLNLRGDVGARFAEAVAETIRANRVEEDVAVRLSVVSDSEAERPIEMVHLRELPYREEALVLGVDAYLEPSPRWTELARHKTLNSAFNLLARRNAEKRGCFDALLRDPFGFLLEGTATNLFIVTDGVLTTPSTERPLLAGITRGTILEIAQGTGNAPCERDLTVRELLSASEAFLTNAVVGIVPLVAIQDEGSKRHPIGSGVVGEQTRALIRAYQTRCDEELSA